MYQRIHPSRYWGYPLLEDPEKLSLNVALKAALAGALAVLGKQLIRVWKASKDHELDNQAKFISQLLIRTSELEVRLSTAEDHHMLSMKAAQEHHMLAMKKCAEAYEDRLKSLSRDNEKYRTELRAREVEDLLMGRSRKMGAE